MAGRWSLWKGEDHLLSVQHTYYSEEYTRFYYRDIQAVIIRKTKMGMIIKGILIFLVLLCPLLYLIDSLKFFLITGLFFGILLIIDLIRGATCECSLQTAVQKRRLHAIDRVKSARKLIRIIGPMIEEAQPVEAPTTPPVEIEKEAAGGTADG